MKHKLFKPHSLEEGMHAVVGDCNGIPMDVRYREETPVFAEKIYQLCQIASPATQDSNYHILDYGCGVGRLAKELLKHDDCFVCGVDDSADMREQATKNANHPNFVAAPPREIESFMEPLHTKFDVAYLVYVLQHVPAIEIREILQRIYYHLKDDGFLLYCSSDYRMAIKFDQPGFFDDRFLGVNLQEELSRYFELVGPAFTDEELNRNPIVRKMVTGQPDGLAHPALIYRKKKFSEDKPLFDAEPSMEKVKMTEEPKKEIQRPRIGREVFGARKPQKLVLIQKMSPGDIMMATVALRDLHKAYPGEYITDVRTPAMEIFENSPYIARIAPCEGEQEIIEELKADDKHPPIKVGDVLYCNLHYPLIHKSGVLGSHFADGMTQFLSEQIGRPIPRTGLRPEIYLDQNEMNWPSPVTRETGDDDPYWVINAGAKSDYPLKQYPFYQEVVDLLPDVKFVQIGQKEHLHKPLRGVVDMVGKTSLRELFRVIHKAQGVLTCVSVPMHIAAAFKKPCVVVAGGREGTRWELYPDHQFLYTNGLLDCCLYDGCWRSKIEECSHVDEEIPRCMRLIRPEDVAQAIKRYYLGGVL